MDLKQLVAESKKGNIDSLITLLSAKQDMLYKIAYTYTQNPYDAEDVLSEATIKAFNKIRQLKEPDKFYKWYTTVLINLCRARYNKQQKELSRLNSDRQEIILEEVVPDFSVSVEDKIMVQKILQSLKHSERDLLVLRFMEDFTIKEIAEIMNVAEGTVKSRLYRTLKKIKKVWREY
ncbi:MAG: sigma-70 family RNA polymerase sigma factor [Clostridia bacterium]|nr:sigma-70 family RNA polymerase sigma factor [Clostridia bacterium]